MDTIATKRFPLNEPGFNPFCDIIGLTFTVVNNGMSRCQLKINKHLLNPHGVVHGGVIYTMADTGMGAALYSCMEPDEICSTIQIDICYFQAFSSGTLRCVTKLIRRTKKLAMLESQISSTNKLAARATGTFYISKM